MLAVHSLLLFLLLPCTEGVLRPEMTIGIIRKKKPSNRTLCSRAEDREALQDWFASAVNILFPEQFPDVDDEDMGFFFEDDEVNDRELIESEHRELGTFEEWCIEFCANPANHGTCVLAGCPGFRRRVRRHHHHRHRNLRRSLSGDNQNVDYDSILAEDELVAVGGLECQHGFSDYPGANYGASYNTPVVIPPFVPASQICVSSPKHKKCDCNPAKMEFVTYYKMIYVGWD